MAVDNMVLWQVYVVIYQYKDEEWSFVLIVLMVLSCLYVGLLLHVASFKVFFMSFSPVGYLEGRNNCMFWITICDIQWTINHMYFYIHQFVTYWTWSQNDMTHYSSIVYETCFLLHIIFTIYRIFTIIWSIAITNDNPFLFFVDPRLKKKGPALVQLTVINELTITFE